MSAFETHDWCVFSLALPQQHISLQQYRCYYRSDSEQSSLVASVTEHIRMNAEEKETNAEDLPLSHDLYTSQEIFLQLVGETGRKWTQRRISINRSKFVERPTRAKPSSKRDHQAVSGAETVLCVHGTSLHERGRSETAADAYGHATSTGVLKHGPHAA